MNKRKRERIIQRFCLTHRKLSERLRGMQNSLDDLKQKVLLSESTLDLGLASRDTVDPAKLHEWAHFVITTGLNDLIEIANVYKLKGGGKGWARHSATPADTAILVNGKKPLSKREV